MSYDGALGLCIYAICKNESEKIEKWINTYLDSSAVDLLVICDTGSTDDTVNKIRKFIPLEVEEKRCRVSLKEMEPLSENEFSFSTLRNTALQFAREEIYNKFTNDGNVFKWIFVSLDIDELMDGQSLSNIKSIWRKYPYADTMMCTGLTLVDSENDNYSGQIVEHKIHSDNPGWVWKRKVHEIISLPNKKQKDWYKINTTNVTYIHEQDLKKERDYYNLLMKELDENPDDIKTLMYAGWEAFNHKEYDQFFKLNSRCLDCINHNEDDEFYNDPEYKIQALINMANYHAYYSDIDNREKTLLAAINFIDNANQVILEGEFPYIRRVSYLKGLYQYTLACEYNDTSSYNRYKRNELISHAIFNVKKALKVTKRPYCWVDDDDLYNNALLYSTIADMYYHQSIFNQNENLKLSISELEEATKYMILSVNNAKIESERTEYQATLDKFLLRLKDISSYVITENDSNESDFETISDKKEEPEMEEKQIQNKICVYAICRNEAQFVDKWVESMKEADSIVVLDTGSTDNTVELLKKYPFIRVEQQVIDPWRFDTARNISLALAPEDCNILVSTDLDEVLEPGWADVLRSKWVEGVHERAIYKYSWSHLENGESGRIFQYDKVHSRNWIWKYPVHELLWNTKTETNLYDNENVLYIFDEMHLHHYPDRTKSRSSYLPLLELRAQEDPDDYYGRIYLAHEYFYQGKYEKSIETLQFIIDHFVDRCTPTEHASCYLFMGDSYKELKQLTKSKDSYLRALEIDPTYREPYLNLAKVLIEEQNYYNAKLYIKLAMEKTYRHFTWVERDASWSYEPFDLMALACYYNGEKRDSLAYALKAYSLDPNDKRLQENVNVILENTSDGELLQ